MIEKDSFKYLIIMITVTILIGLIIFPLFDYLLDTFISNSTFEYSIEDHIISPIVIGTISSIVLWLFNRKK